MGVGQRSAEIHLVLSDARLITMNGTANHNRQLCACFASTCVARLRYLRSSCTASASTCPLNRRALQTSGAILAERSQRRDTSAVLLRYLRTADGHDVTDAAVTDPAQRAVLLVEDTELVDTHTGESVDDDDIDWSTEHQPQRQPAEGTRHANSVVEKTVWVPEYYCRDPHGCGLAPADFLTRAEPIACGQK
jgi:ParB family transcriptional regulator, chromosome partitioning protein